MTVGPKEVPAEEAAVYRRVLQLGTLWAGGEHHSVAAETLGMSEKDLRHALLAAVDIATSLSMALPYYPATGQASDVEKQAGWATVAQTWFRTRDHNP